MFHLVSRAEQSPSAGIWHPENCGSEALDFSLDHESLDEKICEHVNMPWTPKPMKNEGFGKPPIIIWVVTPKNKGCAMGGSHGLIRQRTLKLAASEHSKG